VEVISMSNGKIRYSVAPEENEAFLKEFKDCLTEEYVLPDYKIGSNRSKPSILVATDQARSPYKTGPGRSKPNIMLPKEQGRSPNKAGPKSSKPTIKITNPDMINPKTDPITAQTIIQNPPKDRLTLGEQPFVFPLLQLFAASKQEIPPEIEVLKNQYNIYLIKYGITANPEGNEKITKLDIHLDYPNEFLTYNMTPDTKLEEKFRAYANVETKLDTHLNFGAFEFKPIPGVDVGAGVQSSVEAGFLLHWEYKLLKAKVVAGGVHSSYAHWIIDKPEQMVGDIPFCMVLCIPKDIKELPFTVKGYYLLHRGIKWWDHDTPINIESDGTIIVKLPEVT
jgi:hypothetical protein